MASIRDVASALLGIYAPVAASCTVTPVKGELPQRVRMAVAVRLERGVEPSSLLGRGLRRVAPLVAPWTERSLARPLTLPRGATVVTVGGATLGGSGKTRVSLAVTQLLARRGVRVALAGHAYRASPGDARVVRVSDELVDVGDEALSCARALAREFDEAQACVVVGSARQDAFDHAFAHVGASGVVVLDGPLQLRPRRASLALLAVDALAPWGSGTPVPLGDLRADRAILMRHADAIVEVPRALSSVWWRGQHVPLEMLRDRRVGLFLALARPTRIEAALAEVGIVPSCTFNVPDHGPLLRSSTQALRDAESELDVWLATPKCGEHLRGVGLERPLAILEGALSLPRSIARLVEALA